MGAVYQPSSLVCDILVAIYGFIMFLTGRLVLGSAAKMVNVGVWFGG